VFNSHVPLAYYNSLMPSVLIPAGWFWMGSDRHFEWERPQHRVFVDAFTIASLCVTRREYAMFLEATGADEPRGWRDAAFSDPDQPAVGMNWFEAVGYCEWLSRREGQACRLPTEAEWERACRGDQENTDYAWGNESPDSIAYFQGAWHGPRRVGEWQPNGFGLFNIGDNVHEWCSDWFSADYYATSPALNPSGPESGTRRVSRGGSWRHQIKASRAAHRSSLPPQFKYTDYGFRVVSALKA
jgi:formylglycine-generating enzyme